MEGQNRTLEQALDQVAALAPALIGFVALVFWLRWAWRLFKRVLADDLPATGPLHPGTASSAVRRQVTLTEDGRTRVLSELPCSCDEHPDDEPEPSLVGAWPMYEPPEEESHRGCTCSEC